MPKTIDVSKLDWNVAELLKRMDKKSIDFSVSIQRGDVWNRDRLRNSLLIHSVIVGWPIQNFYFNKVDRKYEGLDGKQRSNALYRFVRLGYKLHSQTPPVVNDDGTIVSLARKTFDMLDEDIRNRILQYGLTIYAFDNISTSEKVEFFTRINNGKQVTATEIARVNVLSRPVFLKMAEHPAIKIAVKDNAKMKLVDEDVVENIWYLANTEDASMLTKDRSKVLSNVEVTQEQEEEMYNALDYMSAIYTNEDIMSNKELKNKITFKTHIESIGCMAIMSIRNNIDKNTFVKKVEKFFTTGNRIPSISEVYNQMVSSGGAKAANIKIRLNELEKAII